MGRPPERSIFPRPYAELYETGVEVYHTVKDMQGKRVPPLFACVTAPSSSPTPEVRVSKYVASLGFFFSVSTAFH